MESSRRYTPASHTICWFGNSPIDARITQMPTDTKTPRIGCRRTSGTATRPSNGILKVWLSSDKHHDLGRQTGRTRQSASGEVRGVARSGPNTGASITPRSQSKENRGFLSFNQVRPLKLIDFFKDNAIARVSGDRDRTVQRCRYYWGPEATLNPLPLAISAHSVMTRPEPVPTRYRNRNPWKLPRTAFASVGTSLELNNSRSPRNPARARQCFP